METSQRGSSKSYQEMTKIDYHQISSVFLPHSNVLEQVLARVLPSLRTVKYPLINLLHFLKRGQVIAVKQKYQGNLIMIWVVFKGFWKESKSKLRKMSLKIYNTPYLQLMSKKGISIKSASSSIRDHINETGHAASFDDFCILDKANNNFDLLIHESLLILRDRPTLNQQNSSIPLYLF